MRERSLRPLFLLWFELEVLIVFEGAPRAAPGEAVAKEESVAEVACFDLVAELARTICIRTAIGWLHDLGTITETDIGIVTRVDVDGKTSGVIG